MIERFFVHDITIIHPGSKPGRGDATVPDWDNATTVDERVWINQVSSDDARVVNSGDSTLWDLMGRAGLDLRPGDRVTWRGLTLSVKGRPNPAWTPDGEHHVEAELKLVEG